MTSVPHKKLTIADVVSLGETLVQVSNMYPTRYLTERDFFPLVVAYLSGRVPALVPEVSTAEGRIDFHLKGNNPTWLELAVQPRVLVDLNNPNVVFSGNSTKGCLYASQNRSELRKLMYAPTGSTRFLLLVDLHGGYNTSTLKAGYKTEAAKFKNGKPVRVVYISQMAGALTPFLARA